MIACPNCRRDTTTHMLPVYSVVQPMAVESCAACSLFWFDFAASASLTPDAVIALFKYIGTSTPAAVHPPLAANVACPRCGKLLAFTHDLQRTTRFTYWRCAAGHGQLITFQQFLREKNFVRTPAPAELAKLRETVRQIACSQCGAPIDLATDSACAHCGAPVALIDPDGVAKALRDLTTASSAQVPRDADAMRAVLADAQADAILAGERWREQRHAPDAGADLLAIGVAALGAWLASG